MTLFNNKSLRPSWLGDERKSFVVVDGQVCDIRFVSLPCLRSCARAVGLFVRLYGAGGPFSGSCCKELVRAELSLGALRAEIAYREGRGFRVIEKNLINKPCGMKENSNKEQGL